MKKVVLLIASSVALTTGLFSADWSGSFAVPGLGWSLPDYTTVGKKDDELLFGRTINQKQYRDIKHVHDLLLNTDGYYTISIFGNDSLAIWGGNYFFLHDQKNSRYSMYRPDEDYAAFDKIYTSFVDPKAGFDPDSRYQAIRRITVPDILSESVGGKKILYSTTDMERYYARKLDGHIVCNPYAKPWATAKDPTGMSIEVEFGNVKSMTGGLLLGKSDHIVLLNGYVNPLKRNLYKDNRRIKTLLIEAIGNNVPFKLTVDFDDQVKFRRIPFPEEASKVKLTILSYYEGNKYTDLCVQFIGTDFDLDYGMEFYDRYVASSTRWGK